jgi:hypothetical protein
MGYRAKTAAVLQAAKPRSNRRANLVTLQSVANVRSDVMRIETQEPSCFWGRDNGGTKHKKESGAFGWIGGLDDAVVTSVQVASRSCVATNRRGNV